MRPNSQDVSKTQTGEQKVTQHLELGWKPCQNDHEDANGQFEVNWEYYDALKTADKHSFFKYMVKSTAEKHGVKATFMPKPFKGLTGNGSHTHISVWDLDGKVNAFAGKAMPFGLSVQGKNFLGGIMKHASALAAITNPTVNSYKRINAPRTISG
jgi:glutamine synthetase